MEQRGIAITRCPFVLYGAKIPPPCIADLCCFSSPPRSVPVASRHQLHADRRAASLTVIVGAQSLTRDTNGDDLADTASARVLVPAAPTVTGLSMNAWLQVTFFSGDTAAPDETSKAIG